METEGKKILVNYLTDIADTFRSITGETDTISAESFSKEVQAVATPSSKNSYQRNSIEEMNAITDAKDGDTCLCYYTNSFNITEDRAVGVITFPKKVVFENAITEFYNADISAADSSIELFGMIDLSPSDFMFRVDKMDDQSRANVFYSSEDGITYILEPSLDVEGNFELVNERTIDFKININIQNTNEYIGAFLVGTNQVFKGLYKYKNGWKTLSLNYPLDEYNVEISKKYYNNGEQEGLLGTTGTLKGVQKLNDFIKKYGTDFVYPKDMSNCFSGYGEERIPLLELNPNTSNVTDMNNLFSGCSSLKSIPAMNTQNVTNMSSMFNGCVKLSTVPLLNTSNVTNMFRMFDNCSSLKTIPVLDTSNVTNMSNMFSTCLSLETIPMLDTSNVTDVSFLLDYCCKLTTVPAFNTSKATEMRGMFQYCSGLVTIPELDASSANELQSMFEKCTALTTFGGLKNIGMGYDTSSDANYFRYTLNLSDSPLLTHDSLMNVINNLYDIKSKGVKNQRLQLGDTNKAKLTAEEIAIATNKGWNVI